MRVLLVVAATLLVVTRPVRAQDSCAQVQLAHDQDPALAVTHTPDIIAFWSDKHASTVSASKGILHFEVVVDSHGAVDSARSKITGPDDAKYISKLWTMVKAWRFKPAVAGTCAVASIWYMTLDPRPMPGLPFTRSADRDGSRFLALQIKRTDSTYTYVSTKDLAGSPQFMEVSADSARPGDVAWWTQFAAVFYGRKDGNVLVYPMLRVPLDTLSLHFGPPRFFRRKAA
ncbi:MAG TPA: hypothetical protein VJS20_06540 [Gemmatimonadales bacterium]|nr:hypothetical protein [Gemmatimonadales bacterium]